MQLIRRNGSSVDPMPGPGKIDLIIARLHASLDKLTKQSALRVCMAPSETMLYRIILLNTGISWDHIVSRCDQNVSYVSGAFCLRQNAQRAALRAAGQATSGKDQKE